jgi:type I restriction enzyme R subunit
LRFLGAKLPRRDKGDRFEPDGEVELKYYKLQKIGEGQIDLKVGEPEPLYGPDEVGSRRTEGEQVRLSSLVDRLNEKFGTHFTPADQLFFDQIEAQAVERQDIQQAAKANSLDDFKLVFDQALDGLFIDRMDGNDEIFRRVMSDERFRAVAAGYLLQKVYGQARK